MNIQDLAKINQQVKRFFLALRIMLYTDYKYLSLLQEHFCDIKYLVHYESSKIIAAMLQLKSQNT